MTTTTDTTPEVRTVSLSPAEYAATVEKIAKINARAERKGFTGRIEIAAERTERTETNDFGFEVTEVIYEVALTGTAPKYNGWTFLARVDWEEAGPVVAAAPGVEGIDRSVLAEGHCAHCGTARYRKNTYVLGSEDGSQVQVGSTCIKDFLGWDGRPVFISEDEASEEIGFGGFGGGERSYDVRTVLAVAWASTAANGYGYSGDPHSTRSIVNAVLHGISPWQRKDAKFVAKVEAAAARAAEAGDRAAEIHAFLLSDEFAGTSEYVLNLKTVAQGTEVSARSLGLLVSAPQAWIRHNEKSVEREAEKDTLVNEFVGEPKDKVEVTVTVKAIRFIEGAYGTTTLYLMVSDTGHTFKWFSSACALGDESEGETFTLKGTIKGHDEYQGRKATILTRCKIV